jgi:hypothetical protein
VTRYVWVQFPYITPKYGRVPEWLRERFAKPSFRNGRVGSNPTSSAKHGDRGQVVLAAAWKAAHWCKLVLVQFQLSPPLIRDASDIVCFTLAKKEHTRTMEEWTVW